MKKSIAVLLALVMVFALCACGSQNNSNNGNQTTQPTANIVPTADQQVVSDPSSVMNQINIIYQNLSTLRADEAGRTFWYTIADLDHNGRLEFIAAITEGTGNYTTAKMYEVNPGYNGMDPVALGLAAGQYMPEIIVQNVDTIKDTSGVYHYVYTDTNATATVNGGHYITKQTMSLSNETLSHQIVAYQDVSYVNGYTVYTTYDGNGVEQDPTQFSTESVLASMYPNGTKSTTNFDWFAYADATSPARLYSSYCVFAGTTSPQPTATPTPATPVPTNNIHIVDVTNPRITKNPTSESLTAGGSCTFIAQAIGYNYMRWQLVSPSGQVYDASSYNPFPANLYMYGTTGQSLTLAGVPQDMNGWAVQAVFTGDTESVTSSPAYIYVSAAPAPVYVTISFNPGQGVTFYDVVNYVTVYSSNGADIRVEATMGGDTGAYYSQTVSSGSQIPIQGVYGQFVSVTVIATCGNSQANITYYVDNTPITPVYPTPTPYVPPTPTDNPGGSTKSGTISDFNADGGGYYVGIDFDDGTSGRYDISYMVSNPPSVGTRVTCNFAADGVTLTGIYYN